MGDFISHVGSACLVCDIFNLSALWPIDTAASLLNECEGDGFGTGVCVCVFPVLCGFMVNYTLSEYLSIIYSWMMDEMGEVCSVCVRGMLRWGIINNKSSWVRVDCHISVVYLERRKKEKEFSEVGK